MKYFSEIYGLVTDNDPVSENGQLFLTTYILLDYPGSTVYNSLYSNQLLNSRVEKGLYHRNPLLTKRTMSHDNMTGIMAWSYLAKTNHRFEIWNYLLKHFGTYDNTKNKSDQFSRFLPFNPSNFFIWGLCADSVLAYLFLPFFLINFVLTCSKPENDTSGKILTWVELTALSDKIVIKPFKKYFEYKMRKMYGYNYIEKILTIYHGNNSKEFPINKFLGVGK